MIMLQMLHTKFPDPGATFDAALLGEESLIVFHCYGAKQVFSAAYSRAVTTIHLSGPYFLC